MNPWKLKKHKLEEHLIFIAKALQNSLKPQTRCSWANWARQNRANYNWLCELGMSYYVDYMHSTGIHSHPAGDAIGHNLIHHNKHLPTGNLTKFPRKKLWKEPMEDKKDYEIV